ncbi:hypothetical protein Bca4012_082346 [Brassica carinata]
MTARRRRAGKEPAAEEADPGDGPDERLPERLFATDRYPSRRLNVYSSLEYLVPTYKDEDFAYWDKLFEGKRDIKIPEVVKMVVEDKSISRGRRLKLCLIIIVDGVLIASIQPAKPTPKHVKLVENLKDLFGFQWGRESFYWTVSTMIPGKKILGKCDDPNGEFCSKLRQKTKKMSGLPLALQLVVYEAIPQLLSRLGGNDELKLIDCERLPQHTGLNLVDVLEAEHNPETYTSTSGSGLCVQLEEGVHETNVAAGPVLKQRRVSTYFRKPTLVDDEKHDELAARVTELEKVVAWMRRRLCRRKRTGATPRKERFSNGQGLRKQKKRAAVAEEDALSAEEKEEHPDNPEDAGDPGGDVGPGRETAADGSEDVSITDGRGEGEMGYSKEDSEDEDKEVDSESNSEAMDVEVGKSSPEGPPPVLVPLKEGDGVPLQWVELGRMISSVAGGSGELGGIGEDMDGEEADSKVKDEDLMDSAGLDKLVGVIFSAHVSGSAEGELGGPMKASRKRGRNLMGHGLEPFGVELMADGYQNTRSGDCGPVAMKFMELHATGVEEPQVDDLTDGLVDIFRKQFAMDVYRDWIVPLYMGGNAGE